MQDRALSEDADFVTLRLRRAHLYGSIGLVVGLVAGLVGARLTGFGQGTRSTSVAASQGPGTTVAPVADVSIEGQPSRGPENAKVTLVEFLDFQCPFCKRYNDQTLPRLQAVYGAKVRFVDLNFPLSIHPLAQKAAEAAECATAQGKFWEFRDVLFRNQSALDIDSLKRYARDLQLDEGRFETCLDGGEGAAKVKDDVDEGDSDGVTATPTFFVNGRRLVGAQAFEVFKSVIDAALH